MPLNGRNFSQLGLLQTGVAPLNAGVLTEGGSLRQGQSYVVNGQRPEANSFILDSYGIRCRRMIKSFRHKGIEHFFKTGSKAGIQAKHATRYKFNLRT